MVCAALEKVLAADGDLSVLSPCLLTALGASLPGGTKLVELCLRVMQETVRMERPGMGDPRVAKGRVSSTFVYIIVCLCV